MPNDTRCHRLDVSRGNAHRSTSLKKGRHLLTENRYTLRLIFFSFCLFSTPTQKITHCILFESLFIELLESGLNLGLASSWIIVTKSNKKVLV